MRQPLQLGWHAAYFLLFIMWLSIDTIKLGYIWNARWHFNTSHLTKAYIKMRYPFVLYRWHCTASSMLTFSPSRHITGKRIPLAKCTSSFQSYQRILRQVLPNHLKFAAVFAQNKPILGETEILLSIIPTLEAALSELV